MRKEIHPKMDETQGFLYLGHANWNYSDRTLGEENVREVNSFSSRNRDRGFRNACAVKEGMNRRTVSGGHWTDRRTDIASEISCLLHLY